MDKIGILVALLFLPPEAILWGWFFALNKLKDKEDGTYVSLRLM
jgi:hypothetical protein